MFYPAAINDNGTIRIYYGTQYGHEEQDDFNENEEYINEEIKMFGRTKEEILSYPDSIIGSSMVVIEDDMLTVKEEAKHVIPYKVKGASFEKHPFFEGSSWYVFYHRLTHKSDYSRQACAEKIYIDSDGNIAQVEVTSCGLNDEPLKAEGEYPSIIACNITNVHMSHGSNSIYTFPFPNVTNIGDERFIAEVENETLIGYKYFKFNGTKNISVTIRKETENNKVKLEAPKRTDERCDAEVKRCTSFKDKWCKISGNISFPDGVYPLYFVYN